MERKPEIGVTILPVAIHEERDGWVLFWPEGPEMVPTAAEALAKARKRGEGLAGEGGASAVVVEWSPVTAIGRMVVKALQ